MNNIAVVKKDICCGCQACIQICPLHCIKVKEDEEGFLYPIIDSNLCINCGKCLSVCPASNCYHLSHETSKAAYAAKCKEQEVLEESASGGMFAIIAKWVLDNKGVVFGATFDDKWMVIHEEATDLESLKRLKKSKYLQSSPGMCYQRVRQYLVDGRWVLYSGTPCQISGLKLFLKNENIEKLICLEVICHGVPSLQVWQKYIKELEEQYNSKLKKYDFRFKKKKEQENTNGIEDYGWKSPKVRAEFQNGEVYQVFFEKDVFTGGFAQNLYLRPSCYNCKWNLITEPHAGDFIVGDYYGIEKEHSSFDYVMGASAVIVNSKMGKDIWECVCNDLDVFESSIEKISVRNTPLVKPSVMHENRQLFFDKFCKNDYQSITGLIRESLGFYLNEKITFGVLGSYNSRWAVWSLLAGSDSELLFHYSNSSLISIMSEPVDLNIIKWPGNNFRKEMLKADLHKSFIKNVLNDIKDLPNYIIIDLLEERFKVKEFENRFITISDAFQDSEISITEQWKVIDDDRYSFEWNNAWNNINTLFEKCVDVHVILIEMYLSERYEDANGSLIEFDDIDEIRRINGTLEVFYRQIENSNDNISVIRLDRDDFWCQKNHRHGVLPCHLNDTTYKKISNSLYALISNNEKIKA